MPLRPGPGDGLRGPNLESIGFRAGAEANRLGLTSGADNLVQSLVDPSAHVVSSYTDDMAEVVMPSIDRGEEEVTAIVACLQSQGGEVDTWEAEVPGESLKRKLPYNPFSGGDPERGRGIFFETADCAKCHPIGDHEPVSMDPDLTEIGAFRDWRWLAESILPKPAAPSSIG